MRRTRRTRRLAAFAAAVTGVTLAGVGFGATAVSAHNGPHSAFFWICNSGVRCNFAASLSSAPSNSVKWGRATGLSTGSVTYNMQWTPGSHTAPSDDTCENSFTIFIGGANLNPDGTGAIDAVTLTMPSVLGVVTKCLMPGGYVTAGSIPANLIASSFSLLTLT